MGNHNELDGFRSVLCVALSGACFLLAWALVMVFKVGPVIATIDAQSGHGVHLGDLYVIPLAVLGVFLYGKGDSAVQDTRSRRAPLVG